MDEVDVKAAAEEFTAETESVGEETGDRRQETGGEGGGPVEEGPVAAAVEGAEPESTAVTEPAEAAVEETVDRRQETGGEGDGPVEEGFVVAAVEGSAPEVTVEPAEQTEMVSAETEAEAAAAAVEGPDSESTAETQRRGEEEAAAVEETGAEVAAAEAVEPVDEGELKAVIEAIVYVAEEPVTAAQLANALQKPEDVVKRLLDALAAEFSDAAHGLMIREVAGGYKMATKPEHHEAVRAFAKSLKPPLKLSLAALETLATIAYKQPITSPEIMEIRGVQGAGVLKTLLDRKLIQAGGRKNVVGRPILYRTSKEFLVQFGLKDLAELPTLKEFEELRRLAAGEDETASAPAEQPAAEQTEDRQQATEGTAEPETDGTAAAEQDA